MMFEIIGNVFPIIRNGANIKQDKVTDGYPITRIETIADGTVDLNRVGYASINDESFSDFYLKENDILMSHINSVSHLGKVALVNGIEKKVIHGMNLLCLKADENKINPEYSYYFFKSPEFRSKIKRITKKSVNQASFNISNLKNIEIPLPPLPDQLHIASILSKAENLIAQRKESICLLDDFLKSTFLEMFGDPVRNERGWDIGKFKDLAVLDRKQVLPSEFTNEDFYIGLEDIEKETGNIIKTSSENAEDLKSSKFRFTPNHILYAKLRPYLNKVALPSQAGICSTDIFPVLPLQEKSNRFFICYLMRSKPFVTEMHSKSSGANLPRASASVIENFKTYQPPIELQTQFAQIVEKTEAIKTQYQQSLQELENLYGSLSKKAFKGELSVKQEVVQ